MTTHAATGGSTWMSGAEYRMWVGPPDKYDVVAAMQFNVMTLLGLREHHTLADIGCGSLRGGRLFIPYLLAGNYYGLEPEAWLVQEGIRHELGEDMVRLKRPAFRHETDFTLTAFQREFDFLLAQSIFSHASLAQIRRCVSEARRVMHIGSIFACTYFEGKESYTGDEWRYPDGVSYRFDDLRAVATSVGLDAQRLNWPHPNGQRWMVILDPSQTDRVPEILRARG